jgi:hypothetical protein
MHLADFKVRQNKRKCNPGDGARTDPPLQPCNLAPLQLGPLPSRLQGCSPGTRYDSPFWPKTVRGKTSRLQPKPHGEGSRLQGCKVAALVLVAIALFSPKTVRVKLRLPLSGQNCARTDPHCTLATLQPGPPSRLQSCKVAALVLVTIACFFC